MASWLTPNKRLATDSAIPFNQAVDRQLRLLDITLATLALVLLVLPMAVGLLIGRLRGLMYTGCRQQPFKRWQIDFPNTLAGRLFQKMGGANWPVLLNIFKGDMAWVGPRARLAGDEDQASDQGLDRIRPGLVNSWDLRRRTAVDFGSELDAELEYLAQRGLKHDMGLLLRALLVIWLPASSEVGEGRVCVGDVSFDNVSMTQAVERIGSMLTGQDTQQVSFVNPACVNIAARERGYRRLLARAALVLPDGIGIKIAADMLGVPLKQNVNGTDLFPRLCEMLQQRDASLFLLGGHPGIAEKVAVVIQQSWPNLRIAGVRDGYFDTAQEGEVAAVVRASRADVLLVARGVPMQDIFIDRHLHQLGVKVAIGVGGLFDFVSGRINRAPSWMRDTGLEWIYRLLQEPSRMWRRYLVGNFTFLGRIMLQRLGLRNPAADELKQTGQLVGATAEGIAGLRTVLFATGAAAPDIPVAQDFPAALLPLGCSTFIERALGQLSDAGVRQIDLVVSSHPENLRQLLRNGERWGLHLRWHLVKDAGAPYGILQSLGLEQAQRVLLGHPDRWIADEALASLLQSDQVLTLTGQAEPVIWAGWAAATPAVLNTVALEGDEAAWGARLCNLGGQLSVLPPEQFIQTHNAVQLLEAQRIAMTGVFMEQVPATWLRTPWGAYSPDALVQAGAQIEGPTLVGPGCMVAAGARIGPFTVLTSDIVISADSTVRNSVVLPHTYVGAGLELDQTIVNARSVQHLLLGVRTVLPVSEGLLMDLKRKRHVQTSWLARFMALLACLLLLPWLLVDGGVRRLRGLPLRWSQSMVVLTQDPDSEQLLLQYLRCPNSRERGGDSLLAHFGACLDILAGRRSWFGARPRGAAEWKTLSRDWQLLLASTPVGCVYAPAWSDGDGESPESRAAADVFFAVRQSMAERVRLLLAALRTAPTNNTRPA